MKSLKMIITATAIFSIVGSALAFKTAKFTGRFVCTSQSSPTCPAGSLKYNQATSGGQTLFCNDGGVGTDCQTQLDHMVESL